MRSAFLHGLFDPLGHFRGGRRTHGHAAVPSARRGALIALGFEFVNGFHDTANAVATVIYTHALPAQVAVVWSGCWNLLGVLASTGAVAFGIVSLLPVELILQVGSAAGYAMVFALSSPRSSGTLHLWFGIPASSSHTLIGSIVGVGVANASFAARTAPPAWIGIR